MQLLAGILLAVLAVSNYANSSVVQALALQDLVANANRIVLGRVLFSESFRSPNGQLGTWHRVAVERELPETQRLDALLSKLQDIIEESAGGINE